MIRATADPLEIRVAYRRAETEALRDPVFLGLRRQADAATTDEEKRAALGSYYQQLFARVRRINPSPALAAHVTLLARVAEGRYAPKRRTAGEDNEFRNARRR